MAEAGGMTGAGYADIASMAVTTVLKAYSEKYAGKAAKALGEARYKAADYTAKQYEQSAGEYIAASQRAAMNERREARLVASRALALAAASGTDAGGVGINAIIGDIYGEGSYRAAVALYEGEDAARKLRMAGKATRYEGQISAASGQAEYTAAKSKAFATVLEGAGSMYQKYRGMTKKT